MASPSITPSVSLAHKCCICFTSEPKYRCPRCDARTCSLPCVKTHKARTLCSGVRDATAFLSRQQLNTEAAFDSDFNLISGIERSIERAGRVFGDPAANRAMERRLGSKAERIGTVEHPLKVVKQGRKNRTGMKRNAKRHDDSRVSKERNRLDTTDRKRDGQHESHANIGLSDP